MHRSNPRAAKALARKSDFPGWRSTDAQEIERRRLRAETEPMQIRPLALHGEFYGDYVVQSGATEQPYRTEIRVLDKLENSCTCMDYRKNGLGTCKHIEAVLLHLRRKGSRRFAEAARQGSPFVEIYLSRKGEPAVRALWPAKPAAETRKTLAPFFAADGSLLAAPAEAVPSLRRALEGAPPPGRSAVRIAQDVEEWTNELTRRQARTTARAQFREDVQAGKRSLNVVKTKLLPYQEEGVLHLAFGERALLADEMGLGKTVQAIAACELLRQTRRIERALVVSPASLKAEWEEQIAKFTSLPSRVIWGRRSERLKLYRTPSFFYLANYEQVLADWKEMNEIIAPDVIILDEAQRIKNWQTRTARTIKRLASPYAFVLTGTPLENRIDEVYSIVEFLDASIFGSLFRFNREFYQLDEKGRPSGFKNLEELNRRLRPVMLRRRKDEVEEQLPPRTVKNFFVGMEPEQQARYEEFNDRVAKLVAISKRRPLTKEEFDKMQRWLACMRMICDTPFILDPECRICPKLDELAAILEDLGNSNGYKIIVFSEWERMLTLARELADELHLEYAWHTGSVPQQKRRQEINRFKQDANCRLFLSTDSGATGLNLQAANVVINLDLPWNPAKLEQRIARAWRKHQTRSVSVINIVCQDSIEHRMLGMLEQKRQLADGVLDGRGDLRSLKMPSGRTAFMERLEAIMGVAPAKAPQPATPREAPATPRADPYETFRQDMLARLDARLLRLETYARGPEQRAVLAVVDGPADQVRGMAERLLRDSFSGAPCPPTLELLDRDTFETIQRLIRAGVLKLESAGAQTLHGGAPSAEDPARQRKQRLHQAALKLLDEAERKGRMSRVLQEGQFVIEALPGMRDAVELSLRALACLAGRESESPTAEVPLNFVESDLVATHWLQPGATGIVARWRESAREPTPPGETAARSLLAAGAKLLEQAQQAAAKAALA